MTDITSVKRNHMFTCLSAYEEMYSYNHFTHNRDLVLSSPFPCQQYDFPDVQSGFRKGRGTKDQIATIQWIIEKAREFQKNIYFCFMDYTKPFDCVDHNKLWKILKEMGIPDHLTCRLRNLYAGQEATLELDMEQQTGSK